MTRVKISCDDDSHCFLEASRSGRHPNIHLFIECPEDLVVNIRGTRKARIPMSLTPARALELARRLVKLAKESDDDGA